MKGGRIMKESQYRFRVWDDFWKEMHYFDFCTNIEVRNGCLWVVHNEGAICLDYVPPIYVMQYTGMKDKDGNKIYKADILKDTLNNLYIVDFIRGCFYLRTNYKSFPHLGWTEWLPMCEIDRLAIPVEFEIIGNIYENPELLD